MSLLKYPEIIEKIKDHRIKLGLSYGTLAAKTGISKSTLQRYETGYIKNLSLDNFLIIAEGLEVSPAYLMGLNENNNTDFFLEENYKTPETAVLSLLKNPLIANFIGYDIGKLTVENFDEFTKDMLRQIELVSYKYKYFF
ncbi:helix-turn-helix domain-containing protein [Clostridium grantii]|uniref:Helix-turn-helix n=1 Tax=Clostridium grantii DSM 8605 TaxID=1121316 RepID=A0A1M5RC74_9CLOT|nr:helix-turn-helix transcriptional regulator [Clostridium grantii]SHH23942.1 Helix-turn-helix [Clostridium grantii DSM 8605]